MTEDSADDSARESSEPDPPPQHQSGSNAQPGAESGKRRYVGLAEILGGILLPAICLLIGYPELPEWQSGAIGAYAQLFLSRMSIRPHWPLLLYCMAALGVLAEWPEAGAKRFVVRFGVYSGVIIATECWIAFQCASRLGAISLPCSVLLSILAGLAPFGIRLLWRRIPEDVQVWLVLGMMAGGMVALIPAIVAAPAIVGLILYVCFWCSTPWALATYVTVSVRLIRQTRADPWKFSLGTLLGTFAWLSAHLAAWRLSFAWMLEQYSRLPKSPPQNCFVCSAAARGHARIVGREIYYDLSGGSFPVNDQLRTLKAFELLLANVCPAGHRRLRAVYDRVGPFVAVALYGSLLATAGYLALKPLEWFSRIALRLLVPSALHTIDGLYRPASQEQREPACPPP